MNQETYQREIRVRIRSTGQVLDMVPNAARALINGGTAVEVKQNAETGVETMTLGRGETAVTPAQSSIRKRRN